MVRLVRAAVLMEQIPYEDLAQYVNQLIWFSATEDCAVTHGPMRLTQKGDQLFLQNNQEPIAVTRLHASVFLQPANTQE